MPDPSEKHDAGRESVGGRAWLGFLSVAMLAVPVWMILTAAFIQLDPSLSGFQAILDGGDEAAHQPSVLQLWLIGGLNAAAVMAVTVPVLALAWIGSRAAMAWYDRRDRLDRERYDDMVRDAAVIDDSDWKDTDWKDTAP